MITMRAASYTLAVVSALVLSTAAFAQINPFGRAGGGGLTADDLTLLEAASSKLYAVDSPRVGATERWNNPTSGNAGTVSLIEVFEKDGMPCRKLRHNIAMNGAKDQQVYTSNRCRVQSGEWKLLF
jgi:surface antigen